MRPQQAHSQTFHVLSPMANENPLPGDWTIAWTRDGNGGTPFYFSADYATSQWDRPTRTVPPPLPRLPQGSRAIVRCGHLAGRLGRWKLSDESTTTTPRTRSRFARTTRPGAAVTLSLWRECQCWARKNIPPVDDRGLSVRGTPLCNTFVVCVARGGAALRRRPRTVDLRIF